MIQLYDLAGADEDLRFSPHVWRVRMALKHKGLDFETIPWRFIDKDAIAFSGQKLVPVLVDGDRTVSDSWEIARHLESTYPDRPSLFGCATGEAHALFVKLWCDQVLQSILFRIILPDLFARLHPDDQPYFRQTREARLGQTLEALALPPAEGVPALREALGVLRSLVKRQEFIGGATPSFADYTVFGAFQWARCVSPIRLLEQDDPVYAWRDRLFAAFDGYARRARGEPI
ncbi:MAG: glutathione S-transferase family protein [Burkholderiales bacterium]